jgi:surfactin synthase thioesterase subunit
MTVSRDIANAEWLLRFRSPQRATVTLLCFPHAGGGATSFRSWADLVPPGVQVVAVQYPGRQNRFGEPCIDQMAPLVDGIVAAVHRGLDGPVALFGHSMGAVVAFEAARRLRTSDTVRVVRLFASAGPAPSARRSQGVHLRDDEGLVAYIRELGGPGADVLKHEEMREIALPMVRSDIRLIETYRFEPGAALDCPVTAIAGDRDHTFSVVDARRWAMHTVGGLDVHSLPGDHFYLDAVPRQVVALVLDRLGPLVRQPPFVR